MPPSSPVAIPYDRFLTDRDIPLLLTVRVVFGNGLALIGAFVLAFATIFVWAFDVPRAIVSLVPASGPRSGAECEVIASESTTLSINKSRVWEHRVRVTPMNTAFGAGEVVRWRTGSGSLVGQRPPCMVVGDVGHTDVEGLRASKGGAGMVAILVMPLIALVLFLRGVFTGVRNARLLRSGRPARATFVEKRPTNTRVNKQTVYEYRFRFRAADGKEHPVVARTHQGHHLMDEKEEPVLYDPLDPRRAVLLDDLPGHPRPDAQGNFAAPGFGWWMVLAPLAGVVLVNALAVTAMFGP
jgi:hypothetical protein